MEKPTVVVGSSTEGLEFARAARSRLESVSEVTLWEDDFFTPGKTFIESLVDSLPRFDFAVLVLTPDDLVKSRGSETFSPRDNVVFELGLFMGQLGRARTFLLYQAGANVKLPSDLAGLTVAPYDWPRGDHSHKRAVGSACDSICRLIRDLGPSERRIVREIGDLRSRQSEQQIQLDALAFVVRSYIQWPEIGHLWGLKLNKPFPFTNSPYFQAELRRLRALGVIKAKPDVQVAKLPSHGELKDYFYITEAGEKYLEYREHFERLAQRSTSDDDPLREGSS
jgi:hypothetical protein